MKILRAAGVGKWKPLLALFVCIATAGVAIPFRVLVSGGGTTPQLQAIPAAEFSRLIRDLSEEEGYFHSDNFTSNETSYLQVSAQLRRLGVSGGAYIGVGPEQNFTYIAKIKPKIAFILDIRRQAVLQHLLYKAIFQQAETRGQFLALLLSRPFPGAAERLDRKPVSALVDYFRGSPPVSEESFARNLARAEDLIRKEFHVPLSDSDPARLEYVYSAFRSAGLDISFRFGGIRFRYSRFPCLADLILQKDPQGQYGNFLAGDDDYQYVRRLQTMNRIIPVVGDFAGSKALASIGRYLARHHYTVSAFYTSNVEQFLYQNGVYGEFLDNVRKLPADDHSVFIRAIARMAQAHPAHLPGLRSTTVLQKIPVFLNDQRVRPYPSYWDLITHYVTDMNR